MLRGILMVSLVAFLIAQIARSDGKNTALVVVCICLVAATAIYAGWVRRRRG